MESCHAESKEAHNREMHQREGCVQRSKDGNLLDMSEVQQGPGIEWVRWDKGRLLRAIQAFVLKTFKCN